MNAKAGGMVWCKRLVLEAKKRRVALLKYAQPTSGSFDFTPVIYSEWVAKVSPLNQPQICNISLILSSKLLPFSYQCSSIALLNLDPSGMTNCQALKNIGVNFAKNPHKLTCISPRHWVSGFNKEPWAFKWAVETTPFYLEDHHANPKLVTMVSNPPKNDISSRYK